MAERKHTHGLEISLNNQMAIIDIGDMEIWDGADLSLIRDTLFRLIRQDGIDSFAIDMHAVQYIPSGFFGMLYDWMERGIQVQLLNPRERVQQMIWFRKFFKRCTSSTAFLLLDEENSTPYEPETPWQDCRETPKDQSVPCSVLF